MARRALGLGGVLVCSLMVACMVLATGIVWAAAPAAASAPASQAEQTLSVLMTIESMPGGESAEDFQGMGNLRIPDEKPALAKSKECVLWHDTQTKYKSALLFDESGGTGTGYDTLHVSFDGDESFAGEVTTYKPAQTDVTADEPRHNFDMTFEGIKIAQTRDRPAIDAKIVFRGFGKQDSPESKMAFSGRLYPPQPARRWAVGSLKIEGQPIKIGIVDENSNGKFTDQAVLKLENWRESFKGDYLLVGLNPDKSNPQDISSFGDEGLARVPLVEYLVLSSGTYRIQLKQSEEGVLLQLLPVQLPGAVVELSENLHRNSVSLLGTRTFVLVQDVGGKITLPADKYTSSYASGESPYEVEAEEGVTAGRPVPKGQEMAVEVVLPDGSPAAGAEAVVIKPRQYVPIEDNHIDSRMVKPRKLGEDGRLNVRIDVESYEVLVLHDAGWAHVSKKDVEARPRIELKTWGAVEGTIRIGSRPGAGQKVVLTFRNMLEQSLSHVFFTYRLTADEKGHFSAAQVVTGSATAGWERTGRNRSTYMASTTNVKVEPGKTATVSIGGTGRPVIGKVEVPPQVAGKLASAWVHGQVSGTTDPWERLKLPADLMDMSQEQQREWWQTNAKIQTEINKLQEQVHKSYSFQLESDGTFRVEDVVAGKHRLLVSIQELGGTTRSETLGTVEQTFEVPAMADGRSDEALDLGKLPLVLPKPLTVGEPLPPLEFTDTHGQPLKIADFAGKYLVVYIRPPGEGPKWIPQIQAIHERAAKDKKLAVVSLYVGPKLDGFEEYAARKGMDWPQAFIGYTGIQKLVTYLQALANGIAYLVSPDGKVLAQQTSMADVAETVEKALAGQLKAPTSAPAGRAVASQPAPSSSPATRGTAGGGNR